MNEPSPELPTAFEWQSLGVRVGSELHAGKQSRVFDGTIDGQRVAVKLTDAGLIERAHLSQRMHLVEALAADVVEVVAPLRINGELVQSIGGWLMTATPFVTGRQLVVTDRNDAELMGQTLAQLHDALARFRHWSIPPVAALRSTGDDIGSDSDGDIGTDAQIDRAGWQLLHGDFSNQNLIMSSTGLCIFDFDDCGHGPPAYDVANSLYMVLFDADVHGKSERYRAFRPAFLDGYDSAANSPIDTTTVDALIDLRVHVLSRWLDDLPTAPIGIRMASPDWHETLHSFVAAYSSGRSAHFD